MHFVTGQAFVLTGSVLDTIDKTSVTSDKISKGVNGANLVRQF